MPTSTFFRLPEEKRQRLVAAAWEEFTRIRYSDVSINRIIQTAHIPRGSFYQYFEDREDLFEYMMKDVRKQFKALLSGILQEEQGDLFTLAVRAFDLFMASDGSLYPLLDQLVNLMRVNRGMDLRLILTDQPSVMPPEMAALVDRTQLREQGDEFLNSIFALSVSSLAISMMETLCAPEQRDHQREMLSKRMEIIRAGSLCRSGEEKEET